MNKKLMLFILLLLVLSVVVFFSKKAFAQTVTKPFQLSWTNNDTNGDGTNIYRRIAPSTTMALLIKQVGNGNSYIDNVTAPVGTQLCYQVSRYNAAGESTRTTPEVCGVMPAPTDTIFPVVSITPPSSGPKSGSLTIAVVATDTAPGVVAKVDLLADGKVIQSKTASPYSFVLDTKTLTDGVHVFTAQATDSGGNIKLSAPVSITTINTTPSAPAGLTLSAISSTSIDISWANTGTVKVPTEIARSDPNDYTKVLKVVSVAPSGASFFRDTGLVSRQTYCYKTTHVVNALRSSSTTVLCGTTQ